jgi:hypothetical protein
MIWHIARTNTYARLDAQRRTKMNAFGTDGEVDGFSDVTAEGSDVEVGSPDPGIDSEAPKPLSPEEYAKLQKEAREE